MVARRHRPLFPLPRPRRNRYAPSSSQAPYPSLPAKAESSLISLLLLSKPNPLRWASVWYSSFSGNTAERSAWSHCHAACSTASPKLQLLLHIVQVDGQHPRHALLLRRRKVRFSSERPTGHSSPASLRLLSNCDPLCWARSWWAALRTAFLFLTEISVLTALCR